MQCNECYTKTEAMDTHMHSFVPTSSLGIVLSHRSPSMTQRLKGLKQGSRS